MSDITQADLDGYSDAEIVGLHRAGKLDHLIAGPAESEAEVVEEPEAQSASPDMGARGTLAEGQVTQAQLATMTDEEIARATRQGRMAKLLS